MLKRFVRKFTIAKLLRTYCKLVHSLQLHHLYSKLSYSKGKFFTIHLINIMTSKAIATTATTALRIGLFGGGIVGGGVIELLQKYNQRTSTELGLSIEVVKICVRSIEKPRDFKYDSNAIKLVTNYQDILGDPSINCVIELMGGR